jgi:hypothetical protein
MLHASVQTYESFFFFFSWVINTRKRTREAWTYDLTLHLSTKGGSTILIRKKKKEERFLDRIQPCIVLKKISHQWQSNMYQFTKVLFMQLKPLKKATCINFHYNGLLFHWSNSKYLYTKTSPRLNRLWNNLLSKP